jgi:soluble lytic murein transglycosylase-like protein
MTAASPSRAAELSSAPVVSPHTASLTPAQPSSVQPDPALHKTLVVRADPRTGKLVRSTVVSQPVVSPKSAAGPKPPTAIKEMVERSARAHDVDPLLVEAVIKVESNNNPHAVSPKGAEGLMQLMPPTARMLGVTNSFDPGQNIEAGVKYLKYLQDLYKDDRLALAAYNAGPGAVDKFKWIPPYKETQNYVYQVGKRYGDARREAAGKTAAPPAAKAVPQVPAPAKLPRLESFIDENGRLHLRTSQ